MIDPQQIKILRDSEEKYRKLFMFANDAVFTIDISTGTIIEANTKAEEMTGYRQSELAGMKVWKLHPPNEKETAKELFGKVASTGGGMVYELNLLRKDGGLLIVDISASVISYGDKKVIKRICRDVTERKKLELELKKSKIELECKVEERTRELKDKQVRLVQSEKMASLGNLVAGVAHEINTPLGALISNNDVVARAAGKIKDVFGENEELFHAPAAGRVFEMIEHIENVCDASCSASKRIMKIVDSLRKFARLGEAELDEVDIHDGLLTTLTLVDHEFRRRVRVHKEFGNLPRIMCHPDQINQVFINLLVNAAHAMEGGGDVYIKTFLQNKYAAVEIRDTGKGIEAENLNRIFDPGYTTKGSGVGTGLGLSIVYQIIKDHKGDIKVKSTPGRGTVFTVLLPVDIDD